MTTTNFFNDCAKCIDMCKKEYSSEFTEWIEKLILTEIAGDSDTKNDVDDKKNETKKLSIETIKKEIIDKLVSNYKVLEYLLQEIRENDENYNITHICRDFIFDYDSCNNKGSYIAVEVAERERKIYNKKYVVSIKLGLRYKENLDKFASLVKVIVSELYPNRYELSDVPFYTKSYDTTYHGYEHEYNELNRLITFEIYD